MKLVFFIHQKFIAIWKETRKNCFTLKNISCRAKMCYSLFYINPFIIPQWFFLKKKWIRKIWNCSLLLTISENLLISLSCLTNVDLKRVNLSTTRKLHKIGFYFCLISAQITAAVYDGKCWIVVNCWANLVCVYNVEMPQLYNVDVLKTLSKSSAFDPFI